jgi:hypothetical protein
VNLVTRMVAFISPVFLGAVSLTSVVSLRCNIQMLRTNVVKLYDIVTCYSVYRRVWIGTRFIDYLQVLTIITLSLFPHFTESRFSSPQCLH